MAATMIAGGIAFAITKQVRASQGVDVNLAFREIPIE
jgi:hypothetical protein